MRLAGRTLTSDDVVVRRMFAVTSGGAEEIRIEEFERFVLVGLSFGLQPIVNIYKTHRLARHARAGDRLISKACLEAAVTGLLEDSIALQVTRLMREAGSLVPIILLPDPLPRRAILDDPREMELWGEPWIHELRGAFWASVEANAERWGIQVVQQPLATVEEQVFTRHEFSVGAVTPSGRILSDDDNLHMNASFGTAVLDELQPQLS